MKLSKLRLFNFRQFYGTSPDIVFAHGEKNITVFHGSNGAGKTALLNAFTWALFDATSRGFLAPDQIVNQRAIFEAKENDTVEAWVELSFEHQQYKYVVKRSTKVRRTVLEPGWEPLGDENPTMQYCGPDGRWKAEDRVFDVIGRVLPSDLHSYFFFDGERIERIVQPTPKERKEIAQATKKLLGVEVLERAEAHLNSARRELEQELSAVGDDKTRELIIEKQKLELEISDIENDQSRIGLNIEAAKEQERVIEARLRELEEARALQEQRDRLNRDREARSESLAEARAGLAELVSNKGYAVFLSSSISEFDSIVESLHNRGELPSGIKQNFVSTLLAQEQCICGAPLPAGSASRHAVEQWMQRAGLADVEERALRMRGETSMLKGTMGDLLKRIDDFQSRMQVATREISRIEDELDQIRSQLEGSPREEISGLEKRRDEVAQQVEGLNREQGANTQKIADLKRRYAEIEHAIGRQEAAEEKQALAKRRAEAASDAMVRVENIRELLEADFRQRLTERITGLFREISTTPYTPELTDDYSLRLLNASGGTAIPVAASQGENQILSLAFIGSIIQLAREMHAKQEHLPSPESSTYPVVMDSPFGSLDPIYRHQIAEHIPKLADQVVTMVTKTQWRGEVEGSMSRRVGRSYVLTYCSPRDDLRSDSINVNGITYDLIKPSPNAYEFTEIIEVSHG